MECDCVPLLKDFSVRRAVIGMAVAFLVLYDPVCQHGGQELVEPGFPTPQCVLSQDQAWGASHSECQVQQRV